MKDSPRWLLHRMMFSLLSICTTIPHWPYTNSLGEKYTSVTKMKYLASPQNWRTQVILTEGTRRMCVSFGVHGYQIGKVYWHGNLRDSEFNDLTRIPGACLRSHWHGSSKPGHDKDNKIELPWQSAAEGTRGLQNLRILKWIYKIRPENTSIIMLSKRSQRILYSLRW